MAKSEIRSPKSEALRAACRVLSVGMALVLSIPLLAADEKKTAPTLDELLNLPAPKKAEPGKTRTDDAPGKGPAMPADHPALPGLPGEPVKVPTEKSDDAFQAAVMDMRSAAKRLGENSDPGIDTQRSQESAMRRLDKLINDMNQKSKSKSKGQPKEKRDSGSEKNAGQKQQKGSQRQKGNVSESSDTTAAKDQIEKGKQNDQPLAEKLAEWGNLPPRMRDQLLQGLEDRFSNLYRQMTEKYYKRLAEEQP